MGLTKLVLKKAGQYGSRNPVSDCVRFVLGDEITAGADAGHEHVHDDCDDRLLRRSPDDVSELVTKPIEDRASTLSGLDTISSQSKENMSIVMLKYKYGTDMNDAYDDLKKQMDLAKAELPEDADDPIMLELNTS